MITFTERDALNGLRQAVAARGESYIYPAGRCIYVTDVYGTSELKPSCIVGYALGCMGVPLRLIYESGCNAQVVGALASRLVHHGYNFTTGAMNVLVAAQSVQDKAPLCMCADCAAAGRHTWGEALATALMVARGADDTEQPNIDTAVINDVIATAEALTTDAALATV